MLLCSVLRYCHPRYVDAWLIVCVCRSQKLKFTADGKTTLSDDTTLSYYMSLRGDVRTIS